MENSRGDNELPMDLDLNLGLPSPSHLMPYDLAALEPESPTYTADHGRWLHQIAPVFRRGAESTAVGDRLPMEVEGRPVVDSQVEIRGARSSHARHRWRRREMRRIRPTVLDLPGPYSTHDTRASGSMGHLLIFSPVDGGVDIRGGGDGEGGSVSSTQRAIESEKSEAKRLLAKALMEDSEEKGSEGSNNFECNICLEVAKEPVVTSCGHLFCWPCLYQWIHVHSNSMECPVCKGEVTDMNVTPIYGRDCSNPDSRRTESGSGLKVPPRPHGCRIESIRQRIYRSTSRRMARMASIREYLGLRTTVADEQDRPPVIDGGAEVPFAGIDSVTDRLLSMHRDAQEYLEQRTQSGTHSRGLFRNSGESGVTSTEIRVDSHGDRVVVDGSGGMLVGDRSFVRQGSDNIRLLSNRLRSDRLAALSARLASVEGMLQRFAQTASGTVNSVPSPPVQPNSSPSINDHSAQQPSRPAIPADDRTSISSTVAVIQSNNLVVDVSPEPASVGSSSHVRRRTSNGASGSSGVDGGTFNGSKRRRLN